MVWVTASIVALFGLVGTLLTLVTLPGTWIMLLVALACKIVVPETMGWAWLIAAGVLAIAGEVVEFGASAAGAKAGGAGKPGALGALFGGLAGGILGTVLLPIPIVGTIVGGVIGAGVLAVLFERWKGDKGWKASSKAGAGAAAGKLASTFLKSIVAGVMATVLTVGAVWGAVATLGGDDAPIADVNTSEHSLGGSPSGMLDPETGASPSGEITAGADVPDNAEDTDVTNVHRSAGGDQPPDED